LDLINNEFKQKLVIFNHRMKSEKKRIEDLIKMEKVRKSLIKFKRVRMDREMSESMNSLMRQIDFILNE
jgi:hypothetical protein